ncbi:DUF4349 domain-containing protein [Piscibacillus salipiscarius]|nr:DUF4349 domain-containing protein [Piscibacillus salipiscarius]
MMGLYACSNDSANESSEGEAEYDMAEESSQSKEGFSQNNQSEQSTEEVADESEEKSATDFDSTQQMIIYKGNIEVEVKDFGSMASRIKQELDQIGGYIVESNQYLQGEHKKKEGYMVVRVPQDHFDSFMSGLETDSSKILSRSQQSEDVSEEYVDLVSRLKAKEAVETRLLQFMEGAEKTEDLLRISDDLSKVQEEIEQIKGRMNYLENHVAFSTIHINITERKVNVPNVQSQEDLNTLAKAKQLFMNTVNFLLSVASSLLVLIVGLSPVLIPLLIIGVIIFIKLKRQKTN